MSWVKLFCLCFCTLCFSLAASEYERVFTTYVNDTVFLEEFPEDARLSCSQLATKYGYKVEEHEVVTEDGYIINIFRFLGEKRGKPLLLMHGILDSSDTWFVRGKNSIGFEIVDAGYDVWAGNVRGNRYGRRHQYLEPDRHAHFWNHSFHDIGYYDMAAMVDFILDRTGENRLKVVGHSQGTTVFYVLCSLRPEYNEKIDLFVNLAPVAFFHNAAAPLIPVVASLLKTFDSTLNALGQHEILGDHSVARVIMQYICLHYPAFFVENFIFPAAGVNPEQVEYEFYKTIVGHTLSGTTRKNFMHFAQSRTLRRFSHYDYGRERNMEVYGSRSPPDYDLSKVTTKVSLFCSTNDGLSSLKDVAALRKRLPNVVEYFVIKDKRWNHGDYLWGRGIKNLLLPKVLEVLNKY